MHKDGHVGIALLLYAPAVAWVTYRSPELYGYALLGALALVDLLWPVALVTDSDVTFSFAMIPDLDMSIPGVEHRGITHTVWFAAVTAALTGGLTYGLVTVVGDRAPQLLPPGTLVVGTTFMAGLGAFAVLTHLVGDAMTPMGIRPLAPLSDLSLSANLWRADNTLANTGLHALGIVAVVAAFLAEDLGLLSAFGP